MLVVSELSVTVATTSLLNAVSFTVQSGEVLAVLGPNGAGKTTLLHALMGGISTQQQWQQHGDILFNQRAITQYLPRQQARQMALLPQFSSLSFPFTAREVVALGRLPHATGKIIDEEIIEEALDWLDITHLSRRLYTQLSGGEKQRVQLARVLVQIWRKDDADKQQRLLVLDEPTASLDLGHQQQLMAIVRRFADQGVGVIMVAHDVNLVSQYAETLLALHNGKVIAQGKPKTVITPTLMKTLYQVEADILPHPTTQQPLVVLTNNENTPCSTEHAE